MNNFTLAWKNITQQCGSTTLSVLLTAFSVAILLVIYVSDNTFEKQLENNSKNIDLVIGAKGSPLQIILSSLYHVDNPTGNIPLSEVTKLADNPFVKQAVPISLGDNYKGHRIIGTDTSFMSMYELSLSKGTLWTKSFEIVIGAEVARKHKLKIGDEIHSAHGLSADAHIHEEHLFKVVGILEPAKTVADNLILSNLASVWEVHDISHDHHEDTNGDNHDHADHYVSEKPFNEIKEVDSFVEEQSKTTEPNLIKNIGQDLIYDQGLEVTALLIKYSSPAAIGVLPRLVNQSTQMQAASPAIESSRIFSLLGIGIDSLTILAYVIMSIAALSVFISLYNALKDRRYDMAIMRTMGASKIKLFTLIIIEGTIITFIGGIIGLLMGHTILYCISLQTSHSADFIEAYKLYPNELLILGIAIVLGIFAAIIPAFKAYNTTISETLTSK